MGPSSDEPVVCPPYTGVIQCDAHGLVLRPYLGLGKSIRRIGITIVAITLALALFFAVLFFRDLHWWQAITAFLALFAVFAMKFLVNETIICLPDGNGVVRECRLVGTQLRWKKLFIPYASFRSILVETRGRLVPPTPFETTFNPNVGWIFTYIRIQTTAGTKLLWYTKYDATATDIAKTLSHFAKCPVEDRRAAPADVDAGGPR